MSKYRDRRQKIQDRTQSRSLDDIVFLESGKDRNRKLVDQATELLSNAGKQQHWVLPWLTSLTDILYSYKPVNAL